MGAIGFDVGNKPRGACRAYNDARKTDCTTI